MKTAEDAEALRHSVNLQANLAYEGKLGGNRFRPYFLCVLSVLYGFGFYFVITPHAMRSPEFPDGSVL